MGYIYKITNTLNSKAYVGKTLRSNPITRFNEHIKEAKYDMGGKRPLYRAIRKYGKENFRFDILEEADDSILSDREKYYIALFDTLNNGYNATAGGDGKEYINRDDVISAYYDCFSIKETAKKLGIHEASAADILVAHNVQRFDIRPDAKPVAVLDDENNIKIYSSLTSLACWVYTERTGDTQYYETNSKGKVILKPKIASINQHIRLAINRSGTAFGHKYNWVNRNDFCKLIRLYIAGDKRINVDKNDRTIVITYRPNES